MTMQDTPHPGSLILERIPALNLTVETASTALGISPESLTEIIEGRSRVTVQIVVQLGKVFGPGPNGESWLHLQYAHDLARNRARTAAKIASGALVFPPLKRTSPP